MKEKGTLHFTYTVNTAGLGMNDGILCQRDKADGQPDSTSCDVEVGSLQAKTTGSVPFFGLFDALFCVAFTARFLPTKVFVAGCSGVSGTGALVVISRAIPRICI